MLSFKATPALLTQMVLITTKQPGLILISVRRLLINNTKLIKHTMLTKLNMPTKLTKLTMHIKLTKLTMHSKRKLFQMAKRADCGRRPAAFGR